MYSYEGSVLHLTQTIPKCGKKLKELVHETGSRATLEAKQVKWFSQQSKKQLGRFSGSRPWKETGWFSHAVQLLKAPSMIRVCSRGVGAGGYEIDETS